VTVWRSVVVLTTHTMGPAPSRKKPRSAIHSDGNDRQHHRQRGDETRRRPDGNHRAKREALHCASGRECTRARSEALKRLPEASSDCRCPPTDR
jgi:hypothetical protein